MRKNLTITYTNRKLLAPAKWHKWQGEHFSRLGEQEGLEGALDLPPGTISIWEKACALSLPRSLGWDLSGIEAHNRGPYLHAASYYKRGVQARGQAGLLSCDDRKLNGSYQVLFEEQVAGSLCPSQSSWIIVDKLLEQSSVVKKFSSVFFLENLGESSKELATIAFILKEWQEQGRPQHWCVVGGGVVLDLCGFAASLVGATYTSIPTTLLAMVDASVGGKTAVNFPPFGKNLIGSFYFPKRVFIEPQWLDSLSDREYYSGGSECLKHAFLLGDKQLITSLVTDLRHKKYSALAPLLYRLVSLKAQIVEEDPYEQGRRVLLNFGHTLGHALEAMSQKNRQVYLQTICHGQAVALGMLCAVIISHRLGFLPKKSYEYFVKTLVDSGCLISKIQLQAYFGGVDLESELCWLQLVSFMQQDKKQNEQSQDCCRWVLLEDLGRPVRCKKQGYLIAVDHTIVRESWQEMLQIICHEV